jgi:uncharacterized protein
MENLPPSFPEPLLRRILDTWHPVAVWLFGSRARGDERPGSDWDLVVVLPDDAPEWLLDPVAARRALRPLRLPVDIVTARLADFEEGKRYFGSLAQIVVDEGRLVYAA